MNYQAVIAIVGTVIVLYVMLGGMKSVALTDTLQGLLFISLLWVIVIAYLVAGFGGSLPRAVNSIWENTREWFSYPGPGGSVFRTVPGWIPAFVCDWLDHYAAARICALGFSGKDMHTSGS